MWPTWKWNLIIFIKISICLDLGLSLSLCVALPISEFEQRDQNAQTTIVHPNKYREHTESNALWKFQSVIERCTWKLLFFFGRIWRNREINYKNAQNIAIIECVFVLCAPKQKPKPRNQKTKTTTTTESEVNKHVLPLMYSYSANGIWPKIIMMFT